MSSRIKQTILGTAVLLAAIILFLIYARGQWTFTMSFIDSWLKGN